MSEQDHGRRDLSDNVSPVGERKKNSKLGYQRTSVACRHCRRRKIRCQPNEEDPNGPCLNCLRMKKECVTVPVQDAATQPEKVRTKTEPSSNVSTPRAQPSYAQSQSSSSTSRSEEPSYPPVSHESSYDPPAVSQPQLSFGSYPNQHIPPNYQLHEPNSSAWSASSYIYQQHSPVAPGAQPQDSSYSGAPESQYLHSHSPQYDQGQHALQHYPHVGPGSGIPPAAYPRMTQPTRSMSYTDFQSQRPYSPASGAPQYQNLRRVVTAQHPPPTGIGQSSSEGSYSESMPYPGQTHVPPSGPYSGHHPQQQYWNQYSQPGSEYQEPGQQHGYGAGGSHTGQHQWG